MEDSLTAKAVPRRVGKIREGQDGTVPGSPRFPQGGRFLLYCTPFDRVGPTAEEDATFAHSNRRTASPPSAPASPSFRCRIRAAGRSAGCRVRRPRRGHARRHARPSPATHQENKPPGRREVSLSIKTTPPARCFGRIAPAAPKDTHSIMYTHGRPRGPPLRGNSTTSQACGSRTPAVAKQDRAIKLIAYCRVVLGMRRSS